MRTHAQALHEEGLALRRARGDEHGTIQLVTSLGRIALQLGDNPRARASLDESLVILRRYDDRWSRAMSLVLLGQVELAEGDAGRAEPLDQALTEATTTAPGNGGLP